MPIVLFDGFCSTCSRWAQWISKRDSKKVFELIPQESPEGHTVIESCPKSLKDVDSMYFVRDNQWFARSSAVCRLLWGLGVHWKIAGIFLWLILDLYATMDTIKSQNAGMDCLPRIHEPPIAGREQ